MHVNGCLCDLLLYTKYLQLMDVFLTATASRDLGVSVVVVVVVAVETRWR